MNNSRKSFWNLLKSESDSISRDEESISNYLKEESYDYEKLKISGQELASKLILKTKAAIIRVQQEDRFMKAKSKFKAISNLGERNLDKLQSLFQEKFGTRYALNFRDLKNMNADEAVDILNDIEILEFLEKHKDSDINEKP